jgi:arylsulfatase A-like enzyme
LNERGPGAQPLRGDPRTRPRLAAGAAAGAATAVALLTAEVATSLLLGSPLSPRAWAFLALYWIPSFAVAGAVCGLFLPLETATAALVWAPSAVYGAAVADQDLLSARPRLALLRIAVALFTGVAVAGAAWATERVLARSALAPITGLLMRIALLLPIVAVLQLTGRALHGAAGAAWLAPPAAAAAAGVLTALTLGPAASRLSSRQAYAAAATIAGAVALLAAWQVGRPSRGALRDDPQPAANAAGTSTPPSVVLIVLDAVRAESLSCYGYERRTTPHLDAFAARGMLFTAATTVSPWSIPSHASIFTGLFAPEHGAGAPQRQATTGRFVPAPLDPSFVTLAEALAERGYATAGVSANPLVAWHTNLAQGFRHYDVRRSPRMLAGPPTLLQRVQRLLPRALLADPLLRAFPGVCRSAEEITDAALGWLARRPTRQPYFLFLNYMDAHIPYVSRTGFSGRWPGRSARLPSFGLSDTEAVMAGRRALTSEEADHLRALYDDSLSYLDHHLGRLLTALDAQGDRDHTWVIVTADHGEALGEHQRLGHDCVLYQQVLHVPLVMRYPRDSPGAARPGGRDERPVQLTGLAPAILAAADAPAPRAGPSLRGAMVASVECFCWRNHPAFHGPAAQALLRDGLKYLDEEGRPPALFDLGADPGERQNVAEARPEDARRLRRELESWRASLSRPPAAGAAGHAAREEALRALGYVQ